MEKKFDDSANSLWKYLWRLVFSSFLSLTRLWLCLLENGAFMKLFKNLLTAARRMLLVKTNTVGVHTTTRHGISAALYNIPLKLLLSGLLFFDGCGNVVSVVDSMFLLLISLASEKTRLIIIQISPLSSTLELRPSQALCSSSSHPSGCTSTPASSSPTQRLGCATIRS